MPERQLNHLADLSHLFPAATDIIVTDLIEIVLLLISLNGLALTVDHCILGYYAVLRRVDLVNLELHLPHTTTDDKQVALANWPVCLSEVWRKVDVKEGTSETLNSIGDGKHRNALGLDTYCMSMFSNGGFR